jgi:hypothetical protein
MLAKTVQQATAENGSSQIFLDPSSAPQLTTCKNLSKAANFHLASDSDCLDAECILWNHLTQSQLMAIQ